MLAVYVFNVEYWWEMSFVESGDKEVFKTARKKLFGSNEKQNDNHILVPDKPHPYMFVV